MSKFVVPAVVLGRFVRLFEPRASEDFKVLKLEISKNHIYLIGCNQYIACVENLGETDQVPDSCYIKLNSHLIETVAKEVNTGGLLTFETLPELAMGSAVDSEGQAYTDFIIWPDESPLDKWREWFVMPTESHGFMYCDLRQVTTLWETSPSGEITFPEVINAGEPVIVRDVNNADWLGVFIPAIDERKLLKPATLPEWL